MAEARAATTVLLLRDAADGVEVFMVQRHRRSGFLPNAWVFPGGRVDDADHLSGHPRIRGGQALATAFGVDLADAVAMAVAGARETFEEAGVWLGHGTLPESLRKTLYAGDVSMEAALDAHDAALELDELRAWSWWVTPEVEPRRYDTRFLVVEAPSGSFQHDDHEVVDSRWVAVRETMAARDQTGFPMAPPTWWTLRELAAHDSARRAVEATRPAARPIQPVMSFDDTGLRLLMPGHPDHPEPEIPNVATLITFDGSWVAWQGSERLPDLPSGSR